MLKNKLGQKLLAWFNNKFVGKVGHMGHKLSQNRPLFTLTIDLAMKTFN